jgi:DNA-directed RNA polymerase subunit RPC12/RpoP
MGGRRNQSFAVDTRMLLVRGAAAARAGEVAEARRYLEQLLRAEPTPEEFVEACLWLGRISDDPADKRHYLEEILARRPGEPRARRDLAILDGRLQPEQIVDPDRLTPAEDRPQEAAARRYTCPRCAARLVFTPDGEALYCEHCGYGQVPEQSGQVMEQDFIVTMAQAAGHRQPVALLSFQCQGCAATFMLAPNTLSVTCPYCDATYSLDHGATAELIPPDGILPFAVDGAAAQKRVDGWLREQKLRGRALVHPLYLPAWTFDVGGAIHWSGERQTRSSTGPADPQGMVLAPEQEEGDYAIWLDDFPVAACHTLPPALTPLLQGYDFDAVVPFGPDYLAGWPAQTYQITVGDASLAARREAFQRHEERVRLALERLQQLRLSPANIDVFSYRLVLVPLWLAHYSTGGKRYVIAVNGQTGEVQGERPPQSVGRWLSRLLG